MDFNSIHPEPFKTIVCNTARELIEALSPLNSQWERGTYIFRGQPSSNYKLVPSVCRKGENAIAASSPRRTFGSQVGHQILFEIDLLKQFLGGCDSSGLSVAGYDNYLKNELYDFTGHFCENPSKWPPAHYHEVLATAQHHGVATRLLDWSKRSYVAAYFAAASSSYSGYAKDAIAIWALDIANNKDWKNISLIDPPGGTSRNLAAQAGLFTVQHVQSNPEAEFEHLPLELEPEIYANKYNSVTSSSRLIKYILPFDEAPDVIKLCSRFGVRGSTLFPGYEGVAREVHDWVKAEGGITLERDWDDYPDD